MVNLHRLKSFFLWLHGWFSQNIHYYVVCTWLLFGSTLCKDFESKLASFCVNGTTVGGFFGCLWDPTHAQEFGWPSQATRGPLERECAHMLALAKKRKVRREKKGKGGCRMLYVTNY